MQPNINTQQSVDALELGQIKAKVAVHHPGNAIEYKELEFKVFYDGTFYMAVPVQDESLARLTGLSGPLKFTVKDNWVTCIQTEFKYVAVDIYHELKKIGKLKP